MIVISDVYVLVVHLLNARPHKLFTLADLTVTVTNNSLQLGDYQIHVEPASAFLLQEVSNVIKEKQRQKKIEHMYQRGLLSQQEFKKLKAIT